MQSSREQLARVLIETGMMPVVKQFAVHFGTAGRLLDIAVITNGQEVFLRDPQSLARLRCKRFSPNSEVNMTQTTEISLRATDPTAEAAVLCMRRGGVFQYFGGSYSILDIKPLGSGVEARIRVVMARVRW